MEKGLFVVFAGINGCGKSTQADFFVSWLKRLDRNNIVLSTVEPNRLDDNGRKAREMLERDKDPYENAREALKYFCENRTFELIDKMV